MSEMNIREIRNVPVISPTEVQWAEQAARQQREMGGTVDQVFSSRNMSKLASIRRYFGDGVSLCISCCGSDGSICCSVWAAAADTYTATKTQAARICKLMPPGSSDRRGLYVRNGAYYFHSRHDTQRLRRRGDYCFHSCLPHHSRHSRLPDSRFCP